MYTYIGAVSPPPPVPHRRRGESEFEGVVSPRSWRRSSTSMAEARVAGKPRFQASVSRARCEGRASSQAHLRHARTRARCRFGRQREAESEVCQRLRSLPRPVG